MVKVIDISQHLSFKAGSLLVHSNEVFCSSSSDKLCLKVNVEASQA